MKKNQSTITTMGILADRVYETRYFDGTHKEIEAGDQRYVLLDTINTRTSLDAFLLKELGGDEYVIAFRGTAESEDIVVDLMIAGHYNPQYKDAVGFVQKALEKEGIDEGNLCLVGHSLGGILTQQVAATLRLKGYAYNPLGANALVKYPATLDIFKAILAIVNASDAMEWAREHILTLSYHDDGLLNGDILSNLATDLTSEHLGQFLPIFGSNKGIEGHSMSVLNEAIADYNALLEGTGEESDYALLSEVFAVNALSKKDDFARTHEVLSGYFQGEKKAEVKILRSLSSAEILALSMKSDAVRYALLHLHAFAIEGVGYEGIEGFYALSPFEIAERIAFIRGKNCLYELVHPI